VFFDKFLYPTNFRAAKAAIKLKPHGSKPELGFVVVSFNMNVRGFITITRITEKAIRADTQ